VRRMSGTRGAVGAVEVEIPYPSLAKLGVVLIGLGSIPLLLYTAPSVPAGLACIGGVTVTAVLLLPFFARSRYDLFEPITFVILSAFLGTTLRTVYIVYTENEPARQWLLLGRSPDELLAAWPYIFVAMASVAAGYLTLGWKAPLQRFKILRRDEWNGRRMAIAVGVLCLISAYSMVQYIDRMGIVFVLNEINSFSSKRRLELNGQQWASSLGYLAWGCKLVVPAFLIYLAWYAQSRKRLLSGYSIILVLLGVWALAFPIMTSSRSTTLLTLIQAFVVWHYLRGRISLHLITGWAIVGITLFLVLTGARKGAEVQEFDEFLSVEAAGEYFLGSRNMLGVAKTAIIIEGVPQRLDRRYGSTYLKWMIAPIPRTYWPGKPSIRSGNLVGHALFGNENQSGVPPGFVGELYMNFGLVGLPFGGFLFGFFLRSLYRSFRPVLRSKNGVLVYVAILLQMTFQVAGSEFSGSLANVGMLFLPIAVVTSWITRTRPAAGSTPTSFGADSWRAPGPAPAPGPHPQISPS